MTLALLTETSWLKLSFFRRIRNIFTANESSPPLSLSWVVSIVKVNNQIYQHLKNSNRKLWTKMSLRLHNYRIKTVSGFDKSIVQ